jgi:hypothetical protein
MNFIKINSVTDTNIQIIMVLLGMFALLQAHAQNSILTSLAISTFNVMTRN